VISGSYAFGYELIPPRATEITMEVAYISSTINPVAPNIASVGTNIVLIGPDFHPVSSQFFLRRVIPPILSKFADVTASVYQVPMHVASIRSYVPGVGANVSAVRAQFPSFPPIDIFPTTVLRKRCTCGNTDQRKQQ